MDDKYSPTPADVEAYYVQSAPAYRNWGPDPDREGIYALHFGYYEDGGPQDNWGQVKEMTRHVVDYVGIQDGESVLDAGCGTGSLSFEIADRFPHASVIGVNITQEHVDTATQYAAAHGVTNAQFLRESYDATSLPTASQDRVLFMESFCHGFDKPGTLAEAARVLKPGGSLFIADTFMYEGEPEQSIQERMAVFERGWSLPKTLDLVSMVELLHQQGFEDIEIVTVTPNALPSIKLMADHAALRLQQDTDASEVITTSRLACVETYALMAEGVIGYFFIKARKA